MSGDFYAEPLEWGHGEQVFEAFLEPTCPFSVKALRKLIPFLARVGEDTIRVRIWLQSQPWHMFSPVICRAVLAASTMEDGREKALRVLNAVADHREEFEFEHHAIGPNRDATPNDILARIVEYSGIDVLNVFDAKELEQVIKKHSKYSRQNGIHVSPTFMVNGLIDPSLGSGDDIETWAERFIQS